MDTRTGDIYERGEYNQWPTCRNTAACERRAETKAR